MESRKKSIMRMSKPELFQFKVSHFNEKVRWALDYKGIEHVRHSLLPGPQKLKMKKLSGQEQTPVLRWGSDVVAGSAAILDYLERRAPQPPLYPSDTTLLRRALAAQARFDEQVGPAIRLAMFYELLAEPAYFLSMFTVGQPVLARISYRAMFPLIRVLMTREMKITSENAEKAVVTTKQGLDLVAEDSRSSGYLVGEAFSVADLTAAALLAPAVEIEPSPFGYPKPISSALRGWWDRWRDHPGTAWVRSMYERHRGVSHEVSAG
jgi:glutathione S-transferase